MDLQSVGKKVDLHRRPLCINAVIPVDDCIQNSFADSLDRIFRPVIPCASHRINDRANLHIPAAEGHSILHHGINGAFNTLIIGKPGRICVRITDLCSRNDDRSNAELRKIPLRVKAEIHDSS